MTDRRTSSHFDNTGRSGTAAHFHLIHHGMARVGGKREREKEGGDDDDAAADTVKLPLLLPVLYYLPLLLLPPNCPPSHT